MEPVVVLLLYYREYGVGSADFTQPSGNQQRKLSAVLNEKSKKERLDFLYGILYNKKGMIQR